MKRWITATLGAMAIAAGVTMLATQGVAQEPSTGASVGNNGGNIVILREEGTMTYFLQASGERVRYCRLNEGSRVRYTRFECTDWN